MRDKNSANELFNTIKTIVDHYLNSRKVAAVILGTFAGDKVMIGDLPVPMSMITGNMKDRMVSGDRLRLLRNDGGREFFILEIIGRPYQTGG